MPTTKERARDLACALEIYRAAMPTLGEALKGLAAIRAEKDKV